MGRGVRWGRRSGPHGLPRLAPPSSLGWVPVCHAGLRTRLWVTTGATRRCWGAATPEEGRALREQVLGALSGAQAGRAGPGPHLQRCFPALRRCCCWAPPRWPAWPWTFSSCSSTPSGCAAAGARARSTWTPTAAAPPGVSSSPHWCAGEWGGAWPVGGGQGPCGMPAPSHDLALSQRRHRRGVLWQRGDQRRRPSGHLLAPPRQPHSGRGPGPREWLPRWQGAPLLNPVPAHVPEPVGRGRVAGVCWVVVRRLTRLLGAGVGHSCCPEPLGGAQPAEPGAAAGHSARAPAGGAAAAGPAGHTAGLHSCHPVLEEPGRVPGDAGRAGRPL